MPVVLISRRNLLPLAALLLASVFPATSSACTSDAKFVASDARFADVVILGELTGYRIVADESWRKETGFESPPGMSMSDYAILDIKVSKLWKGQAEENLSVVWENSTFSLPETLEKGTYVLALRKSGTPDPPLRAPSATVSSDPEPGLLNVLQAPCAPLFILRLGDKADRRNIRKIERILGIPKTETH